MTPARRSAVLWQVTAPAAVLLVAPHPPKRAVTAGPVDQPDVDKGPEVSGQADQRCTGVLLAPPAVRAIAGSRLSCLSAAAGIFASLSISRETSMNRALNPRGAFVMRKVGVR